MKRINYIGAPEGTITAIIPELGKSYLVGPSHPAYAELKRAIFADDVAKVEKLYDVSAAITNFGPGIKVEQGVVYLNGQPMHNLLTDRILTFMNKGLDHQPLMKFMVKLHENPSKNSVDQLFNFLDRNGLVVCDDGDFIGYKRVQDNWTDFYSGKLDYSIGKTVQMPRNQVADDPDTACSYGIHVGSTQYVSNFHTGRGHVILVKVNPADAVSVPRCEADKMRVCKVVSLAEYKGVLEEPVFNKEQYELTYGD